MCMRYWTLLSFFLSLLSHVAPAQAEDAVSATKRLGAEVESSNQKGAMLQSQVGAIFGAAQELGQLHQDAEAVGEQVHAEAVVCHNDGVPVDTADRQAVWALNACYESADATQSQHVATIRGVQAKQLALQQALQTTLLGKDVQPVLQARWGQVQRGHQSIANVLAALATTLEQQQDVRRRAIDALHQAPGVLCLLADCAPDWCLVTEQVAYARRLQQQAHKRLTTWHAPLLARRVLYSASAAADRVPMAVLTSEISARIPLMKSLQQQMAALQADIETLRENVDAACAEDLFVHSTQRAEMGCRYMASPHLSAVCRQQADEVCDGEVTADDEQVAVDFFEQCLGVQP
jgi:hypothetical protein